MSEIFHVVASDIYAEKNSSPKTLHLGPSPSIISKRQQTGLIHYSEVRIARLGDYFIQRKIQNYSYNHQLSRPTFC